MPCYYCGVLCCVCGVVLLPCLGVVLYWVWTCVVRKTALVVRRCVYPPGVPQASCSLFGVFLSGLCVPVSWGSRCAVCVSVCLSVWLLSVLLSGGVCFLDRVSVIVFTVLL